MGISVEDWRCRIGRNNFHALIICFRGRKCRSNASATGRGCRLAFALILLLLVAGDVETNPGPRCYSCTFCDMVFTALHHYVQHQEVHFSSRNFRFPCCIMPCDDTFHTVNAYRIHLLRRHTAPAVKTSSSLAGKCSVVHCKQSLSTRKEYMSHSVRHLETGSTVDCAWCSKSFSVKKKFQLHASAYHKDWAYPPTSSTAAHSVEVGLPIEAHDSDSVCPEPMDTNDVYGQPYFEEEEMEDSDVDLFPPHLVKEEIAKFYLMLEGKMLLPSSTVQRISEQIALLSRLSHFSLKRALKQELKTTKLTSTEIDTILTKTFKQDPVFNVHHKGEDVDAMTSTHLRFKYTSSHFPLVVPKEELLPKDDLGKNRVAHRAPIRNVINALLKDKECRELIEQSFSKHIVENTSEKIYADYTDGEAYRQHKEGCRQKCLQLILFQDCFEFQAFGAAKGLYKINATYFTIGNLPPEYRSKEDLIQCAYLIKEADVKALGFKVAFAPLITDLQDLHKNGVEINGEIWSVCVMFMTGDNAGLNAIGGYLTSFNAEYVCRNCEGSMSEFRDHPSECKPLRTPASYNCCLEELAAINKKEWDVYFKKLQVKSARLKKKRAAEILRKPSKSRAQRKPTVSKQNERGVKQKIKKRKKLRNPKKKAAGPYLLTTHVRGVKENSVLNELPGFHVCSPARLPPCLAHDLFEKIVNVILGRVLHHCIEVKQWFTFDTLNRRIKSFTCKASDKQDAPVPLKTYESVEGHAIENWTLLRLLPFILDGLIKEPLDEVWQLYLSLKEITEYVCAPKITLSQVCLLKTLIFTFVEDVKRLFPDCMYPKLHYLVHYPDLIAVFGPLIRLWTMRYESKHRFFKTAGLACKNFKNITLTLINKYQLRFAYDHCSRYLPPDVTYESKTVSCVSLKELPENMRKAIEDRVSHINDLSWTTRVNVKGITYERDLWLVIKKEGLSDFEIGCIERIILINSQPYFLLRHEAATNTYRGYYELSQRASTSYSLKTLSELPDYYPLASYIVDNKPAVSLKHSLVCM